MFLLVLVAATQATAQSPGPDPAPPGRKQGAEFYVGILGGPATYKSSTVETTTQSLFGPATTARHEVDFDRGHRAGIRTGFWGGGDFLHMGFTMELDAAKAKAAQVDVNSYTCSFLPMLRLPLLQSEAMPGGRVSLYMGLGLMTSIGGKAKVSFAELPHPVSGTTKGTGFEALAGVSLCLGRITLLVEYRHSSIDLRLEDIFDQGRLKLEANQTLLGATCRF
jgi:hypothetical protein